jgi:hypothetical protein
MPDEGKLQTTLKKLDNRLSRLGEYRMIND